jgi:hypothetical protein
MTSEDLEQSIDAHLLRLQNKRVRMGISGGSETIQIKFLDFYNECLFILYKLGTMTENNGHSRELDKLKDRAFRLIGL